MLKHQEQPTDLNRQETEPDEKEISRVTRYRREILRKLGRGASLGLAARAIVNDAQVATTQEGVFLAHASWVHGHTGLALRNIAINLIRVP